MNSSGARDTHLRKFLSPSDKHRCFLSIQSPERQKEIMKLDREIVEGQRHSPEGLWQSFIRKLWKVKFPGIHQCRELPMAWSWFMGPEGLGRLPSQQFSVHIYYILLLNLIWSFKCELRPFRNLTLRQIMARTCIYNYVWKKQRYYFLWLYVHQRKHWVNYFIKQQMIALHIHVGVLRGMQFPLNTKGNDKYSCVAYIGLGGYRTSLT